MRAIWTGTVVFGLVNVPVKAYSATGDHGLDLHQVHDKDGGRIRYERRCDICDELVEFDHIDKAYDDGERTVVLTDEDMDSLPAAATSEIEVVRFVPSAQINPVMLGRSYYLEPESESPKAYVLLRRALEESDRTAVVKFALRRNTRLGALRVHGSVLLLQALLWSDEIREPFFEAASAHTKVGPEELEMASALVEQFAGDFVPEDFEDDYQVQLRALIDAKLAKGEAVDSAATFGAPAPAEAGGGGEESVLDLMEALKRSLETMRGGAPGRPARAARPARPKGAKGA